MLKPIPEDVLKLIEIYKTAQQNLIDIIAADISKGNVTGYKKSLLAQVNEELDRLNNIAIEWSNTVIPQEYKASATKTLDDLHDLGVDEDAKYASFSALHNRAIRLLVRNTSQTLIDANSFVGRQIKDNIRTASIAAITQKYSQGETVKETKKNLINILIDEGIGGIRTKNGSVINIASYAELVARSTTREASNQAAINQLTYLERDLVQMSTHNNPCKICAIFQGRVYSISGKSKIYPPLSVAFRNGYSNVHPNCFVEGTIVTSPHVFATSVRDYCGEVITFTTSSGNEVTVTPNHPILTPKGWVIAGLLQEGEKVVENRFSDRPATLDIDPNNINIPTKIEDVVHSFGQSGSVSTISVKVSPEDFHGDGINSKICIININCFLRNKFNIIFNKYFRKSFFVSSYNFRLFFNTDCSFQKSFMWLFRTFKSYISGLCKVRALFRSHSLQSCTHSFAPTCSFMESIFRKSKCDNAMIDAKRFSNGFFGLSRDISSDDFVYGKIYPIASKFILFCGSKLRKLNSIFFKSFLKNGIADVEDGRYLLNCISEQIKFSDIIQINRKFFHGKVYNLQTKNNWYIANNIITHNCRHVVTPYVPTLAEDPQKDISRSNESFTLDKRSQSQIDAYDKEQNDKTKMRNDRYQYQNYKLALGDDAPKTFSGFRKMKNANSERYQQLKADYRGRNSDVQE